MDCRNFMILLEKLMFKTPIKCLFYSELVVLSSFLLTLNMNDREIHIAGKFGQAKFWVSAFGSTAVSYFSKKYFTQILFFKNRIDSPWLRALSYFISEVIFRWYFQEMSEEVLKNYSCWSPSHVLSGLQLSLERPLRFSYDYSESFVPHSQ